ncbi:MAG TPA: hypothetical protein VGQ55_07215 [Pyrinomonadaceae bacterium]|jgi:hypothetical protein|nr:hypothetical protein [Pyrinomonadaceae bacterium]
MEIDSIEAFGEALLTECKAKIAEDLATLAEIGRVYDETPAVVRKSKKLDGRLKRLVARAEKVLGKDAENGNQLAV